MIRVLLDTNVVLDGLLEREPWAAEARAIIEANGLARITGHVTASSLTDIFYVSRKLVGPDRAWQAIRACLDQLAILPVTIEELLLVGRHDAQSLSRKHQPTVVPRPGKGDRHLEDSEPVPVSLCPPAFWDRRSRPMLTILRIAFRNRPKKSSGRRTKKPKHGALSL